MANSFKPSDLFKPTKEELLTIAQLKEKLRLAQEVMEDIDSMNEKCNRIGLGRLANLKEKAKQYLSIK